MGKNLIQQRRGRGTFTYLVPRSGKHYNPQYISKKGVVKDIVHDKGRDAPIIEIQYEDGSINHMVAPRGIRVGDPIDNVGLPLSQIQEGSQIFALETYPNSGPKLCMAPGSFATVVSKTAKSCLVKMPSRKEKSFSLACRVTLGIPAGDGRSDRPFTKAGFKHHYMRARGKLYPRTSPVKMNAIDHPFGGATSVGTPMTISRHAPPGAKVGSVAARRTGRKNK